jgi:hypothetical protein
VSITDTPQPLPDCAICSTPTRRIVHRRNGGMCSSCRKSYEEAHGEQQRIPVVTAALAPRPPDLSNVVVLQDRRGRPRTEGHRPRR